jgi:hypothetical protein
MLVALCSVKSAGVTTAALALAGVLPVEAAPAVVECDPAGGDIARRHGLPTSPGVVELAAYTRAGGRVGDDLTGFTQDVSISGRSVAVVVAPPGGAGMRVALDVLARPDQPTLNPPDRIVIVDCGRLLVASPAWPLLGMADAVWVLARGRVDELAHLREHLPQLHAAAGDRLRVVLAAGGVYGAGEVAEALSTADMTVPVVGPLPYDEAFARLAAGEPGRRRGRRLCPLPAAVARLVDTENLGPSVANRDVSPDRADEVVR